MTSIAVYTLATSMYQKKFVSSLEFSTTPFDYRLELKVAMILLRTWNKPCIRLFSNVYLRYDFNVYIKRYCDSLMNVNEAICM